MKHLRILKICDMLQSVRDDALELDQPEDAAILELLYQKYIKLFHEHLRS